MYDNLTGLLEARSLQTNQINLIGTSSSTTKCKTNMKPSQYKKVSRNVINAKINNMGSSACQPSFGHQELYGEELIAVQVLGTCLNTTNNDRNSSKKSVKDLIFKIDQLRRKRSYDGFEGGC